MAKFKTTRTNAYIVTQLQNQESTDTNWYKYQAQEISKYKEITPLSATTNITLYTAEKIGYGNQILLYSTTDGSNLWTVDNEEYDSIVGGYKYDISTLSLSSAPTKVFPVTLDFNLDIDTTNTTTTNLAIKREIREGHRDRSLPNPFPTQKETLTLYSSTDGNKSITPITINSISTTTENAFSGYPCEFDYYNRWHRHNILHNGLIDTSTWTTDTNTLLTTLFASQVIITKSRVYLLGGRNDAGDYLNTIYYADIDANGVIGLWQTDTNTLPGTVAYSQAIVTQSRVYLLGGQSGTSVINTIYYADIDANGVIGSWQTDTNTLPGNLRTSQAVVTKSRVYLLGGFDSSAYTNVIYYADIDSNGIIGAWSTDTNTLPGVVASAQAIITQSRVYLLGGYNGSSATNIIYYADIDSTGVIGSWQTDTNTLPGNLRYSQAVVTKSRVYLLGGYNGSAINTIYYANMDGWEIDKNGYDSTREYYVVNIDISEAGLTNVPTEAHSISPRVKVSFQDDDTALAYDYDIAIDFDNTTTDVIQTREYSEPIVYIEKAAVINTNTGTNIPISNITRTDTGTGYVYQITIPTQSTVPTKAIIPARVDDIEQVDNAAYDNINDNISIIYQTKDYIGATDNYRSIQVKWAGNNINEENYKLQVDLWKA